MPTWIRIALIVVLALVLWWLAATLARGVAQQAPEASSQSRPTAWLECNLPA
jgi:hypothetical protein